MWMDFTFEQQEASTLSVGPGHLLLLPCPRPLSGSGVFKRFIPSLVEKAELGGIQVSNGQLPVTEQDLRQIEGFVAAVNRKRSERPYKHIL